MQGAEGGAHSSTSEDKQNTEYLHASCSRIKKKTIRIYQQILKLKTSNSQCCLIEDMSHTFTDGSTGGELVSIWTDTQSPPGLIHTRMATATIVQEAAFPCREANTA